MPKSRIHPGLSWKFITNSHQWRIASDQIFLDFMQFSGQFNKIVSLRPPPGWRHPGKILDPPLVMGGYRTASRNLWFVVHQCKSFLFGWRCFQDSCRIQEWSVSSLFVNLLGFPVLPLPHDQFFSTSCSIWENLIKSYPCENPGSATGPHPMIHQTGLIPSCTAVGGRVT